MATEPTDPLSRLRAQVAELESMDLDKLRARAGLFAARVSLEDLAGTIASDVDLDAELVLLVVRAAWAVRLDVETGDDVTPEPDVFASAVEGDVRAVLEALAEGVTETGDPVVDRALARTIELGKQGVKIIPVREMMDRTKCMIGNRV